MTAEYPYQNLSLSNLPNEQWRDVPGFEGLYKVSNLGRVKSLSKERKGRWDKPALLPERMLRQRLRSLPNKLLNTELHTLIVPLSFDAKRYHFSVGRLVYHAFVESFDLDDTSIYIGLHDKNGKNLTPSNLYMTNLSQMRLQSYEGGRAKAKFGELSKPVTQFGADGIPIVSFPSMYEAGKKTGFKVGAISKACSGQSHVYKGFFWKWGIHKKPLKTESINSNRQNGEINTELMKRLKLKESDMGSPPAFLNLSLKNMKGERWKDVPGYEGLYKVSNLGRVKTMSRISSKGTRKAWIPEYIKYLTVVEFKKDKNDKLIPGTTVATLSNIDGKKKTISVARMVYYCFVATFEITNRMMRIYYRDGNTLNLCSTNLLLKYGIWSINKR